jgi:phage tail P2-like protein
MSTQSLLPDNRTVLETALEKSLSEQLAKIESPFYTLWDSQKVPNHLLPYLAHAKGVPEGGDDTEQAKRDTVANIWPVQRQAGTKKAIKKAVDSLGFDAEVKRGDQPYHLHIDLWREDVGTLEPDILARAHRRINQVKSERDVVALTLSASANGEVNTAIAVLTSTITSSFCDADSDSDLPLKVGLSSCASLVFSAESAIEHLQTDVSLYAAVGTSNRVRVQSYPDTQQLVVYPQINIALAASFQINQTITECY